MSVLGGKRTLAQTEISSAGLDVGRQSAWYGEACAVTGIQGVPE